MRGPTLGAVVLMLMIALAVQAARFLPLSVRLRVHAVSVLGVAAVVSTGLFAFLIVLAVPPWRC